MKGNYGNAVALRKKNANLKVLIGIGGYNAGSLVFSDMALTAERRQTFIARWEITFIITLLIYLTFDDLSVIKFIMQYDFDGLAIDWEYPAIRGGRPEDRPNFTLLVKVICHQEQLWPSSKFRNLILVVND